MDTSYKHMHSVLSIRLAAALTFVFTASLLAQTAPAAKAKAAAVQIPSPLPLAQPLTPPVPLPPSQLPPHRALITYTGGALSVSADNSSLNQILREISRETGIKISGGVNDERVFGQYGPGTLSQVLASLLDGTGSNMLILYGDGAAPAQLILTSRQGGPTPPNPNAALLEERNATQIAPGAPPVEPAEDSETNRPSANATDTPGAKGAPPASNANQPEAPNGVKTPQQIYEQLQRLRQQQQPQSPE
jgi:hypothetical protein